jgi:transposase
MSSDTNLSTDNPEELKAQIALLQEQLAASEADRKVGIAAREEAERRAEAALRERDVEFAAHALTKAELEIALRSLKVGALEIEKLKVQLARLKRQSYGQSSERLDTMMDQLELTLEDMEISQSSQLTRLKHFDDTAVPERQKRKPKRLPLPDHLPRIDVVHEAPGKGGCVQCGNDVSPLGEDVTEILEYTPARFHVIRHVRPKVACKACDHIAQAKAPPNVIPRGRAGPKLLAHILVSKFADHLPLYRQSVIYKREGVDLNRSTIADWVGQAAWLLQPLVDHIGKHVFDADKIHTDDTTVKVLDPGRGKTKTGRLWVYKRDNRSWHSADPPAAIYYYSPDRKSAHPQAHLGKYKGFLQADAYAGYAQLYDLGRKAGPIVEVGCWAHARRKLYEVWEADRQSIAAQGLEIIKALYALEDTIRGAALETRQAERQKSNILVNDFFEWAEAVLAQISVRSALAGALHYAVGRKQALLRFTEDPRLEIDNNSAENSMRGIAIGRKNYLFAGADVGGERAAAIYSLIETARLNGLDPQAWLGDVLERIAHGHTINRIEELLPWNWKPEVEVDAEMSRRKGIITVGKLDPVQNRMHSGRLESIGRVRPIRVLGNIDDRPLAKVVPIDEISSDKGQPVPAGDVREIILDDAVEAELIGRIKSLFSDEVSHFRCERQNDGSYMLTYLRKRKDFGE